MGVPAPASLSVLGTGRDSTRLRQERRCPSESPLRALRAFVVLPLGRDAAAAREGWVSLPLRPCLSWAPVVIPLGCDKSAGVLPGLPFVLFVPLWFSLSVVMPPPRERDGCPCPCVPVCPGHRS